MKFTNKLWQMSFLNCNSNGFLHIFRLNKINTAHTPKRKAFSMRPNLIWNIFDIRIYFICLFSFFKKFHSSFVFQRISFIFPYWGSMMLHTGRKRGKKAHAASLKSHVYSKHLKFIFRLTIQKINNQTHINGQLYGS